MKVEIWSDVVCPWCYIGKRRFESALAQFEHNAQVEVVWRSYELDPHAPRNLDESLYTILSQKYGTSVEQAKSMTQRLVDLGAQEGLDYNFEIARSGNTFDAHRLIHLAATHHLQGQMKERLMRAYFTEGQPIGDTEILVKLATEVGLDADKARSVLTGDAYADEVRADEKRARMFGIQGVPFFAIDEKYGISGAQPTEVFSEVLEQAWAEAHPLIKVGGSSHDVGSCDDDSCII